MPGWASAPAQNLRFHSTHVLASKANDARGARSQPRSGRKSWPFPRSILPTERNSCSTKRPNLQVTRSQHIFPVKCGIEWKANQLVAVHVPTSPYFRNKWAVWRYKPGYDQQGQRCPLLVSHRLLFPSAEQRDLHQNCGKGREARHHQPDCIFPGISNIQERPVAQAWTAAGAYQADYC